MSGLDDVLRAALREGDGAAGAAVPPAGGWDDVRARARRRRVRRMGAAAMVVVAAAGLVVRLAAYAGDRDAQRVRTVDDPQPGMPGRIVAGIEGDLGVIDARDGSTLRVYRIHNHFPTGAITVTASGVVLFNDYRSGDDCEWETNVLLQAFDLRSGERTGGGPWAGQWDFLGLVHDAVVSPGGERVAIGACLWEESSVESLGSVLGIAPLDDVLAGVFDDGSPRLGPRAGTRGTAPWVEPLGFLPSGRLLVRLSSDWSAVFTVDPDRHMDAPLGEAPVYEPFPMPADTTAVAVLGDSGAIAVARKRPGGSEVVEVDAATGEERRPLFDLPGTVVENMNADASGRHLVLVGQAPSEQEKATLWRWSRGDAPTRLGEFRGLHDAAWVPDRVPTAPVTSVPDVEPLAADELVALRADHSLVVLDADTGEVRRDLGSVGLGGEGVGGPIDLASEHVAFSLAPDRRTVFHDGARPECHEDARLIFSRQVEGRGGDLVGGGVWPSADPDGSVLAYLGPSRAVGCGGPSTALVVRDLDTDVEREWEVGGGDDVALRIPVNHLDGERVVVAVERPDRLEWWVVDTTAPEGELAGERIPFDGEVPYGIWARRDGRLVAAFGDGWIGHIDVRGRRGEEIGCPRSVEGCRVHDVLLSPDGDRMLLLVHGEGVRRLVDAETGELIADGVVAADW